MNEQWFKLSKYLLTTDEDVLIRSVYIPPEHTKYIKQDILDLFYSEVEHFNSTFKYVILLGDVNARTADIEDICNMDDEVLTSVQSDADVVFHVNTNDKNIGNFTCRNASVVDYTIIQYRQMQWLSRFKVDEFCPLFSDVHCPSLIHIESFNDNAILPPSLSEEKIKHWSNDKKGDFLDSIDGDKVQAILIDLDGNID